MQRVLHSARQQLARVPRCKKPNTMQELQMIFQTLLKDNSLSAVQIMALVVLGYAGFFHWDDLSVEKYSLHSLHAGGVLDAAMR